MCRVESDTSHTLDPLPLMASTEGPVMDFVEKKCEVGFSASEVTLGALSLIPIGRFLCRSWSSPAVHVNASPVLRTMALVFILCALTKIASGGIKIDRDCHGGNPQALPSLTHAANTLRFIHVGSFAIAVFERKQAFAYLTEYDFMDNSSTVWKCIAGVVIGSLGIALMAFFKFFEWTSAIFFFSGIHTLNVLLMRCLLVAISIGRLNLAVSDSSFYTILFLCEQSKRKELRVCSVAFCVYGIFSLLALVFLLCGDSADEATFVCHESYASIYSSWPDFLSNFFDIFSFASIPTILQIM